AGPDAVMGHEVVAEVDVDPTGAHSPGELVVVFPPRGCGDCYWCRRGEPRHCEQPDDDRWGGYAEYAVYPADHLLPVPSGLSPEVATLADPLGVAARAVEMARPGSGDVVYVNGLGPIGLSVVSMLIGAGCRVIGGDLREDRRKMAELLGPIQTVDPYREDPYELGREMDPAGPTVAFECSGSPQGLQEIFDAAGPGGTVAILGIPKQPVLLLRMTVREQSAFSIAGPTIASMEAALDHLATDSRLSSIITSTVSLEEAHEAFEGLVEARGDVKVLIDPRR
ncbi:MAG: zinc-binding dehydrogenase, partial [Acidimicrobiia bacterium]